MIKTRRIQVIMEIRHDIDNDEIHNTLCDMISEPVNEGAAWFVDIGVPTDIPTNWDLLLRAAATHGKSAQDVLAFIIKEEISRKMCLSPAVWASEIASAGGVHITAWSMIEKVNKMSDTDFQETLAHYIDIV